MHIWSKNFARAPLILLALIETSILFASVYFAFSVALGNIGSTGVAFDSIAPRAGVLSFVMLMSMIAMGLYQFHQRAYYHEVIARLIVGAAVGSAVLVAVYYLLPSVTLQPRIVAMSVLSALVSLLLVRYLFARHVDENMVRHRTLV